MPFPSPGDLPDPGTEPATPTLKADSSLLEPPGKPNVSTYFVLELINMHILSGKKKETEIKD